MQYYKTIDELLKGIGDITQSSVYQSVRTGANAPARNIAAIAQGKTLPYQRQLSSARKAPNVVNQIASIGTYTNPYLSPNKDVSEQYKAFNAGVARGTVTQPQEQNGLFGVKFKPITKITGQDMLNDAQFLGSKLAQGINYVTNSLNPMNIINNAIALELTAMNTFFINPALKARGKAPLDNVTLTKGLTNLVQAAGGGKIDTSAIKSPEIKAIAQDINNGTDVLDGLSKRSTEFFAGRSDEVANRVSKATEIIGDVVQSAPQTAILATPYGQYTFWVSTITGAINEQVKDGKISNKDMEYALYSAETQIASEMIFSLFAKSGGLFKGSLERLTASGVKPTTGMLIKATLLQGAEEGAEEMIAFPFQIYVDWKYKNPNSPAPDYLSSDVIKKWGEAGLVGFISGALMTVPQVVKYGKLSDEKKARVQELSAEILATEPSALKEEDVAELADLIAESEVAPDDIMADGTVIPGIKPTTPITPAEFVEQIQVDMLPEEKKVFNQLNRWFDKYAPNEPTKESAQSPVIPEWMKLPEILESPLPSPVQAPTSPLQTQDTSMPTEATKAPPAAPSRATQALEDRSVTVTREIPLNELSTSELVAKVKADYPDPQIAYGQFVKARSLKPEIDAKEFNRIFASVNANRQIEKTEVGFKPTHTDSIGNRKVQVTIENSVANMVWEDGATGSEPLSFFNENKRYAPIQTEPAPVNESAKPTPAQPIPPKPTITQEPTVKVGSKNVTKAQLQNAIAKLNKRAQNPLNDADRQEIANNLAKLNKVLLKFEQKVAEPLTASIEEMVAEEGKKEASAEAAQGIVATGYAQAVSRGAVGQPTPWRNIESQETQDRIDAAFDPKTQSGWKETLKNVIKSIQLNVFSGSVPVNKKYGDFRTAYRKAEIAWQTANKKATSIITTAYNHAGQSKQELLTRSILYADMKETIDKGKYNAGYALAFGIKSPQQVIDLYNVTQNELNKPENVLAKEAMQMRKTQMQTVRNDLIRIAAQSNVDLSRLASYDDYMTHFTLQYSDEFNGIKSKNRRRKAIDYKGREGSPMDYITNPVITDFLILKKMLQDTEKFKLYYEMKKMDIANTLTINEDGEWDIPEGYAEIDPSMLGVKGIEDVLSKVDIMANADYAITTAGWPRTDPRAKHILRVAKAKANKYTMVVPADMVSSIERLNKPYNTASRLGQKSQNIWKYTRIRVPGRVWRYNLRNMYGDIDAALMLRPSAMLWVPKSIYQLYQHYYKGRIVDPELMHYIERNGLITGEARVNMRTFKDIKGLKIYEEKNAKTLGIKGIKKLWSMLTMETFTDFREQILRYATYRSVYDELKKNQSGLPKFYMASLKSEIKGISDLRDRAAKLANDAIGAYDDVSMFGKYLADHLIPFFRFKEVNTKRYFRMTFNTFRYDPDLMASQGSRFAKQAKQFGKWGAFTTYKVAKTMIGLGIFQGLMLTLWNNLFAGKEEDELPEDVKRKPHLTMPGWMFGDENLHYITDLGSFSEFLSYFGLDYGVMNDIKDMATGRLTVDDYFKNAAKSSLFDIVTGSMPGVQMVIAALGGVTIFPDPTKPTQIKDTLEYMADQVGMKEEYKAIAGLPIQGGQYSQQFIQRIFKEITPGEAAVWDAYDLVEKYRQLNNLGERYSTMFDYKTEEGKRHLAAYNYKVALKMQDKDAAEKYLAEYIAYGGTKEKFDSVMRWWYPAAGLKDEDKTAFEKWLVEDNEDWQTYADANAFIDSLVTEAGPGYSQMP